MNSQATDTSFRERMAPLVRQGTERARDLKQDVLVSISELCDAIDPIRLFANTEEISADRWYWEYPDGGLAIASAGVITGSTYPRRIRFSETEWNHRQMMERAIISPEPGPDNPGPILFGAFSFDPYKTQDRVIWQGFPTSFFLVPRASLLRTSDRHLLTINFQIGPNRDADEVIETWIEFREAILDALSREPVLEESPPPLDDADAASERDTQQYLQTLNTEIDALQRGDFEWLTSVRRLKVSTSQVFNVSRMVDRLRTEHPEFRTIAASRHGSTWVGLSRDILASVQGDSLSASCSLGSIRRGDSPELDQALATHLRSDEQTLENHTLMVQAIEESLRPLADSISVSAEPEIWSLDEAHVLRSRVQAKLHADTTLLKAVSALHPSPGMTGYPVQGAEEFLREYEELDRGWCGSPFGWIDYHGNGEFVAPERGAVVRAPVFEQQRVYLFNTNTVVSGTDPEQQTTEAESGLAPLLSALTE